MSVGVIDTGVAIAWIRGATRSRKVLDRLYRACRNGSVSLVMSTVNLAEVLIHTAKYARASGVDPVTFLTASGLRASAARHHQLLTSQRSRSRIPWPNSRNISLNRTRRAALSIMRVKT